MSAVYLVFARRCLATLALFVLLVPISSANAAPSAQVSKAPPPKPIDWDKLTQEATDTLVKYIKINTTNPRGTRQQNRALQSGHARD